MNKFRRILNRILNREKCTNCGHTISCSSASGTYLHYNKSCTFSTSCFHLNCDCKEPSIIELKVE